MSRLPFTFYTTPTSSNPIPASELDDNFNYVNGIPDNATLALTPASTSRTVWRNDYAAGVGAPPQLYKAQAGTCAFNGMVNDGASCVDATGGNSWVAAVGAEGMDFRQWGAQGGQNVDTELAAAVAWAGASHLPLRIPYPSPVNYYLNSSIEIGNGSATANSTINGITIICDVTYSEFAVGNTTPFVYNGSDPDIIPIVFRGPMQNVKAIGIGVDCSNVAKTGIKIINAINSEFGWFAVRTNVGDGIVITSEPSNIWGGGMEGSWLHDFFVGAVGTGGCGAHIGDSSAANAQFTGTGSGTNLTTTSVTGTIQVHAVVSGTGVPAGTKIVSQTSGVTGGAGVYVTDQATTSSGASLTCTTSIYGTINNRFEGFHLGYDAGSANTYGLKLGGLVQSTFLQINCQPVGAGGLGNSMVISPPPGDTSVPEDIVFIHPVFQGTVLDPGGAWTPTSGIRFLNWSTAYTTYPVSASFGLFWGDTDTGFKFPGPTAWTPVLKFGGNVTGVTGTNVGKLIKDGERVTAQFQIVLPGSGSFSATGAATITGLPFAQLTGIDGQSSSIHYLGMSAVTTVTGILGSASATIGLYNKGDLTAPLDNTNFTNGAQLYGTVDFISNT